MTTQVVTPTRRITRELLADLSGTRHAVVSATEDGVVAGIDLVLPESLADSAGVWRRLRVDGESVSAGEPIITVEGSAWELAVAEDHVLGALGAAGGMARRASELVQAAPLGLQIACGGWKKLPAPMKPVLHAALAVAGISTRLVEGEFVYIDKNSARHLGGISAAVAAGTRLDHGPVAVQVTSIREAIEAAVAGAGIVMVDVGIIDEVAAVDLELRSRGLRDRIRLAFAGGVTEGTLAAVADAGADIVDVGRAILDAPLWDLHMVVTA